MYLQTSMNKRLSKQVWTFWGGFENTSCEVWEDVSWGRRQCHSSSSETVWLQEWALVWDSLENALLRSTSGKTIQEGQRGRVGREIHRIHSEYLRCTQSDSVLSQKDSCMCQPSISGCPRDCRASSSSWAIRIFRGSRFWLMGLSTPTPWK